MPGPESTDGFWAVRLRDPGAFTEGSFRTIPFREDKPRIFAVVGRLKGEETTTLQSLRFPKEDDWTKESVADWMDKHPDVGKAQDGDDHALTTIDATGDFATLLKHLVLTSPHPDRKVVKFFRAAEIKGEDEAAFEADVVISTGQIDRDREVVQPEAVFRSARAALQTRPLPLISSHDYSSLRNQIGEIRKVERKSDQVYARPRWYVGEGNPEADWGHNLAVKKKVAAFSIGFMPKKWQDANLEDETVRASVMAGEMPMRIYTKIDLVEVSQVLVPSNPGALGRMLEKGLITETDFLALIGDKDIPREGDLAVKGVPTPDEDDLAALFADPDQKQDETVARAADLSMAEGAGKGLRKGLVAEALTAREKLDESWGRVYDLWWAVIDLTVGTIADTASAGRAELLNAILDEFLILVRPELLALAAMTAEQRQAAKVFAGPPAPREIDVRINERPLILALEAWGQKLASSLKEVLQSSASALPAISPDSLAFMPAKDVADVIASVAKTAAVREVQRALGNTDYYPVRR